MGLRPCLSRSSARRDKGKCCHEHKRVLASSPAIAGADEQSRSHGAILCARVLSNSDEFSSPPPACGGENTASNVPSRHCERSEAIQSGIEDWIASSLSLLAMTKKERKKNKGSGTPADAVFHDPQRYGVRGAPTKKRLAPPSACGCARLPAFHHGTCGSDRTPPLSSCDKLPRAELGRDGHYPPPAAIRYSEAYLAGRSSCRPVVSAEAARERADEATPAGTALAPLRPASPGRRPLWASFDSLKSNRRGDDCQYNSDTPFGSPLYAARGDGLSLHLRKYPRDQSPSKPLAAY